jgi:hypothetical protein
MLGTTDGSKQGCPFGAQLFPISGRASEDWCYFVSLYCRSGSLKKIRVVTLAEWIKLADEHPKDACLNFYGSNSIGKDVIMPLHMYSKQAF